LVIASRRRYSGDRLVEIVPCELSARLMTPSHTVRFGAQIQSRASSAEPLNPARHIGYLTKYLTKDVARAAA